MSSHIILSPYLLRLTFRMSSLLSQDQVPLAFLPPPPPRWSEIKAIDPYNPNAHDRPPVIPEVFPLKLDSARCRCGSSEPSSAAYKTGSLMLFRSTHATLHQIVYLDCKATPECVRNPYQVFVSDLGEYEVFIWSAGMGDRPFSAFSWELLNLCSSQLLTSETPLASFVHTMDNAYKQNGSEIDFCGKGMFSKVSLPPPPILSSDTGG